MSQSIINFPVPASSLAVTVNDETANGVKLAQNGDTLTITDGTPPPPSTITGVTATGPATLNEGATAQFNAQVTGTGSFNPAVTWSCTDGSISASGLFTAPMQVETVTVKATSVQDPTKFSSVPVSIALPGNTVQIQASGGDDTAALQAAFNSTASAGKVLEMNTKGGTFHTNPLTVPANLNLLIDPGVLITDQSAYGTNSVMFNVANSNVKITGTGAFAQMPLSFAQSQKDQSEYRHCIALQANPISNVQITGLSISQAGGDGVYLRNCTNVTVTGVSAKGCYRNGMSITGQVTNLTLNSCSVSANLRGGFDIEPNTPADFLTNVVLNNCASSNGIPGGLSFGIYALDKTTKPVSITCNGYTSINDGGYGIFFTNNNNGNTPSGSITVNNAVITNSGFGGAYGRYTASGPQITFNGLQIINPNQKGMDTHYGMNSATGVDLTGGVTGPCGGVNFNVQLVSSNNKNMVNYFQQGNQGGNAQNTTFKVVGSVSGATNPNAVTKYP